MTKTAKKPDFYLINFLFLTCFVLLFLTACNTVQNPSTSERLDSLFQNAYKNGQFNGAVLVAEKGKPVYEIALGYSDTAGHPLQLNSPFNTAQVTRQFTTMAIMMLQEQGKLKYSDHVKKYIPEFPYEGITLYHLLTFTDGLPYLGDLANQNRDTEKRKKVTSRDMVKFLVEHKPKADAQPGEKLGWAGTGSVLMAYIIEKVSGESYADFLENHIFRSLEMDNTFVYDPLNENEMMKNRAHVIKQALNGKDLVENESAVIGIVGDDGIYSTLSDLLKWDRALYTEKLVKKATLQRAFTPAKLKGGKVVVDDASVIPGLKFIGKYHYGFGWDLDTLYGSRVVFHGGFPPNGSFLYRNLDKDRTVILLTNNSTQNSHFYHFQIFDRVLKILNDQPVDPVKKSIADEIGRVFSNKGTTEAIVAYRHLRQSEPAAYNFDNPMELFNLGNELLTEGRTDDALAMLKLNAEEFPDHGYSHFLLGRIYMMKENYPAAKKSLEKVIEIFPDAENSKKMLKMIDAKMKDNLKNK